MRRFFIDKNNISKNSVIITGEEAHHIKDVIRLKINDRFIGFDGKGFQYTCRISKVNNNKIEAIIEDKKKAIIRIPEVTLACAIPKAARMDYIVQKATELGVRDLIPMQTERTEVKLSEQRVTSKIKRWERIAKESSKQCGRSDILKISKPKEFSEVIINCNEYRTKLIPCLHDNAIPIKDILSKLETGPVIILIGPEGDFTISEVELATGAGFIPVSLAPLILRVDTAAIFTLSVIMCELFSN